MVVLNKLRINIFSNDKKLKEYEEPAQGTGPDNRLDLTREATQTVTRYVKAKPGKQYHVRIGMRTNFDFGPDANCLSFRVYIDGDRVRTAHISKSACKKHSGFHHIIRGVHSFSDQGWQRFPFCWHNLVTTDETPTLNDAEMKRLYGEVGTIRVEVWRKFGHRGGHVPNPRALDTMFVSEPIPERAIKGQGIDMSTQVGQRRHPMTKPPHLWSTRSVDDFPIAEFSFKYRSKKALQAIGVLPRSPSPTPLEERNPHDLSRDELLELARRFQASRQGVGAKK